MRSPSQKDYSVYDFNVGDDVVESRSRELLVKYATDGGNVQQTEISDVYDNDLNGNNGDSSLSQCSIYTEGMLERDFASRDNPGLDDIVIPRPINNTTASQDLLHAGNLVIGCVKLGSSSIGGIEGLSFHREMLHCALPDLPSDEMISDEDESIETSSLPSSASDIVEDEGADDRPAVDTFFSDYEDLRENHTEVTVFPDYVFYGGKLTTHSRLTFESDCVAFEDRCRPSNIKWDIDDIIHVETQWSQTTETCLVTLRLRLLGILGIDNEPSNSGIEKLTCAVYDPNWRDKELKITSFASKLKDKWNTVIEGLKEHDDFMGQNSMFSLKRYITNFDEPFEDVVYPKEDPDAVSISKRDIELLQPETFVNDTIIDFYIKYLNNKIPPENKHRFHFFNSFFFRKLADPDNDPGSSSGGTLAFQRVRKWTRKVNIFEKDYIFIPVNYNLHWSLIVICHPGDIAYFRDGAENAEKVPCILHMDSIKGSHNGLKNLIQSYLYEEWKARNGNTLEDTSKKFSNLRFVPLELPQQENSFDCGLFLLHYVEMFLEEAPVNFSPFKITKLHNFLNVDWFPPIEASHKRSVIRRLIYELFDEQCRKVSKSPSNDQPEDDIKEKENAVEFLPEQSSPAKKLCATSLPVSMDGGMQKIILSPSLVVQCDKETRNDLHEYLEGANTGLSSDEIHKTCNQNVSFDTHENPLLLLKEKEFPDQPVHSERPDEPSRISSEPCSASCAEALKESCSQEILMQPGEESNRILSSESSSSMYPNSSEVDKEDHASPLQNGASVECVEEGGKEKQMPASTEIFGSVPSSPESGPKERQEELAVEDSLEGDHQDLGAVAESKESGDTFFSCQENLPAPSTHDTELTETMKVMEVSTPSARADLWDKSEQRTLKRQKIEHPEVQRRRTRSITARNAQ